MVCLGVIIRVSEGMVRRRRQLGSSKLGSGGVGSVRKIVAEDQTGTNLTDSLRDLLFARDTLSNVRHMYKRHNSETTFLQVTEWLLLVMDFLVESCRLVIVKFVSGI